MKTLKTAVLTLGIALASTASAKDITIDNQNFNPFSINNTATPIILAADNTKKAKAQLEGARASVEEHIGKYKEYPHQQDKDFALGTVRRVQAEIAKILTKRPNLGSSWQDTWKP